MHNTDNALSNAISWMETIHQYVLASDPDSWDRLEELRGDDEDPLELAGLEKALGEFENAEDARDQAMGSILELTLSGTWNPGETPEADGYTLLLTTGGPGLRIVGTLGDYKDPTSAVLEYRDWGTPWRGCPDVDENDLIAFASIFYFGE